MITNDIACKISEFKKRLDNNFNDLKTNSTKQHITAYTKDGERLFSIKNILNETGLAKNKVAYNLRVLCIKPCTEWNRTHLYNSEKVTILLNYLLMEYEHDQLKLQADNLMRNRNSE